MTPLLVAVGGPTGVGKTAFAIALAQALGTEILSFDARQVYKLLHIGVNKPTPLELSQAKHHGLDLIFPNETFNAAAFAKYGNTVLTKLFQQKEIIIAVGGTGFYLKALLGELDEVPAAPLEIRTSVSQKLITEGLDSLIRELKILDPEALTSIDIQNPRRICRALEVCYFTKQPYSSFLNKTPKQRAFNVLHIALDMPRDELYAKINSRTEQMLENGLVQEVETLLNLGYAGSLNAFQTIGYKETIAYLSGDMPKEALSLSIAQNTRHYAKRQLTWWRGQTQALWIHPSDPNKALLAIREISR